jgi:hypothetical protein
MNISHMQISSIINLLFAHNVESIIIIKFLILHSNKRTLKYKNYALFIDTACCHFVGIKHGGFFKVKTAFRTTQYKTALNSL